MDVITRYSSSLFLILPDFCRKIEYDGYNIVMFYTSAIHSNVSHTNFYAYFLLDGNTMQYDLNDINHVCIFHDLMYFVCLQTATASYVR